MADDKHIRKQIRNVLQEDKDKLLTGELYQKAFTELKEQITTKLVHIENEIKSKLDALDDRQKQMQSYLAREMSKLVTTTAEPQAAAPVTAEVKE